MSWQAASFGILALVLAGAFLWYERQRPPARVLALVAALAALAVVGRVAFAAVPNVKPVTDIVLFAGYALGGVPGFAVGAITALVSNVFFSQGPWTAWQMVGWGFVGAGGALLARVTRGRELSRIQLALVCGAAGAAFGAWMDLYQWTLAARQDLATYVAISGTSLPYNVAHVLGNVGFCLLIGPAFVRALRRYRRRFEVRWQPHAPHLGAAALVLALALVTGASLSSEPAAAQTETTATTTTATTTTPATTTPAPVEEPAGSAAGKTPAQRALAYLLKAQNADGGFGPAPKQGSTALHSGWTALGLATTGRNAQDVKRKGGKTAAAYLLGAGFSDIGSIERTALVAAAAGLSPRSFAGRDLVAEILKRKRGDGSIAGQVSYTSFGILALKAAGQKIDPATVEWLQGSPNPDGGFGVVRGSISDSDMTGVALEALGAVGRGASPVARGAVAYLRGAQNADGGFGQRAGSESNSQSTSYAIQGLVAAGGANVPVTRAARYVARLQRSNGSIAYSATSTQTPVWATAQALMALKRVPLPIAAAPRKSQPSQAANDDESESSVGADIGGGASAPAGDGGAVSNGDSAPSASTPTPGDLLSGDAGGGGSGGQSADSAPPPTATPLESEQSIPTPDGDPADSASAQRAAAKAGDGGVPPGLAIAIGLGVLALAVAVWLLRRPLRAGLRRGGQLLPGRLRRRGAPDGAGVAARGKN
jgi:Prenyltransferase and squalene oxidase repeat